MANDKKKRKKKVGETLCWKCQNAYADKCEWIASAVPVKGWKAESTTILYAGTLVDTFRVDKCPNFVQDEKREPVKEVKQKVCKFCGKEFKAKSGQERYCSKACRAGAHRLRMRERARQYA